MSDRPEIRIHLRANQSMKRVNEPVTCGVPFPKGLLRDDQLLGMFDEAGNSVPLQTRVLDKWSDGSARWVLCDWQASCDSTASCFLRVIDQKPHSLVGGIRVDPGRLLIQTGQVEFGLQKNRFPFESITSASGSMIDIHKTRLVLIDQRYAYAYNGPTFENIAFLAQGPIRACVLWDGWFHFKQGEPLAKFSAHGSFFAGSPIVRFQVTVTNHHPSEHPSGLWDLGNSGSLLLPQVYLTVSLDKRPVPSYVRCSATTAAGFENVPTPFELHQDSSGGPNWQSTNHLNRNHTVPNTFQGYRLKSGDIEKIGLRATPILTLDRGDQHLAVSMPYFWQNFPKAIEADNNSITLSLFPHQYADVHELQGGEQKTHVFYVSFGRDTVTEEPLAWTRDPLIPVVDPEWVASTGAVPYLTPRANDPHAGYLQLVDAAIEGPDTFEKKREIIDEYGWRHFGEIYGDHEAVYHQGPSPLVSHYNNQYDAVAGLLYQYLRSGDVRWWRLGHELASHVIDIDIYHTERDKAAYNHGLFWHTYHYVDADTGTHRSYPKRGRIPPHGTPVPGGGPANEQNYATGLMLHYFLTGDIASKEAAVGLAQWVIDMDDGSKTVFRWLSRGDTGLASQSRTPFYHGPGRGSANSISVLLDGHRLTGERKFLAKAEQLLYRCIHPSDDVPARNLLDAENRWFYTMFLQSLGKYLDYKAELGELDEHFAYARACILHYARWMAEHEYPYLEKPEILEYPTETWAAQDMRKCEIFQFAALHAEGEERERFRERAEYFFQYSVNKLLSMPTRTLCRPVVLMLSNGFSRAWHKQHPDAMAAKPEKEFSDFGSPERFVPQKVKAIKRFKKLVVLGGVFGVAAFTGLLYWLLS